MLLTFDSVIANFGVAAKEKLSNPAATGQPEDQLRAPFERLISDLAALVGVFAVTPVGESSLSALKTRPDYAVTVGNALVGFVEMKAPGKGGDPRKFKDPHDKVQWDKLHSLPNLIYTDGNAFSLWQDGELVGSVIRLDGDIETSGASLKAPLGLLGLFDSFLRWQPIPPSSAKALAETTARLCRLLREEVTEQLELKSEVLTGLAEDWRKLLFPEASDERFADGYAQAVTFGLLMARTRGITLSTGLQQVANELSKTTTLIGAALKLLTDDASNQATLKTSLGTLTRVLDAVDWTKISKDFPEAWLYFYEDFLSVYDNTLRKRTGSYYTPPEVVAAMVALTDEALRSRFGLHAGLASPSCHPSRSGGRHRHVPSRSAPQDRHNDRSGRRCRRSQGRRRWSRDTPDRVRDATGAICGRAVADSCRDRRPHRRTTVGTDANVRHRHARQSAR